MYIMNYIDMILKDNQSYIITHENFILPQLSTRYSIHLEDDHEDNSHFFLSSLVSHDTDTPNSLFL
jgi:hypothetical protein